MVEYFALRIDLPADPVRRVVTLTTFGAFALLVEGETVGVLGLLTVYFRDYTCAFGEGVAGVAGQTSAVCVVGSSA